MRFYLDYGTGIVVSFVLHGAIISAMYLNWNPESSRIIIQPDYIRAELVQLNSKRTKTDHLMQSKSVQKRVDDRRRLAEKNKAMQAVKTKRAKDRIGVVLQALEEGWRPLSDCNWCQRVGLWVLQSLIRVAMLHLTDLWSRPRLKLLLLRSYS